MQWNCSIQLEKNSIQDSAASQFELKMIILIIDQSLYSLTSLLAWHRFWPSIAFSLTSLAAWHGFHQPVREEFNFRIRRFKEFSHFKSGFWAVSDHPGRSSRHHFMMDLSGTSARCSKVSQIAHKMWPIRCGFQYEVHSMRFTNMESNSMKSTSSPQHEAHTMKSVIVKSILVDCMLIVRTSPRLQAVTRVRLLSYRPEITLRSRSVPKKRRVAFLHLLSFSCNTQQPEGQNKLCCFLTFKLIVTVLIR